MYVATLGHVFLRLICKHAFDIATSTTYVRTYQRSAGLKIQLIEQTNA